MSYKTKIDAITARITKLETAKAELVAKAVSFNVAIGDSISFKYGRAEKVRTETGTVVARKSQAKGADLLKVQIGTGFDTEFVTICPNAIIAINAVETTPAA